MTNLSSKDLKVAGTIIEVNNATIEVVEYLTAKEQYERGLVTKTEGTQVLYRLKINGEETELKGSSFAKFCKEYGFIVEGKTGGNSGGRRKTFKEKLQNLLKEFEKEPTATDLLDSLLSNSDCPEWLKKANEEEQKRIEEEQKRIEEEKEKKEFERLFAKYGKTAKTKRSKK